MELSKWEEACQLVELTDATAADLLRACEVQFWTADGIIGAEARTQQEVTYLCGRKEEIDRAIRSIYGGIVELSILAPE